MLYGICNEIAQHLPKPRFVAEDLRGAGAVKDLQGDPAFGVHRPRVVRGITGQRQQVHPAQFQRPVRI
ncbi:Uncharacterised protein [Mycobacterium tuberculosis]|uniref:Uncharacterized protein n=1 Tax=Mycobacterium tuberculosis TaxID=1773 RepID=A0A916PCE9_MYCTX|nr:Uncharacterised protein [Mycobacterium tuberculosis]